MRTSRQNKCSANHGISDARFYNCKSKYGGVSASELKRCKPLLISKSRTMSDRRSLPHDAHHPNRAERWRMVRPLSTAKSCSPFIFWTI